MLPCVSISTAKCASGFGAGPPLTAPFASYVAPWHGQRIGGAAEVLPVVGATSQPACVQVVVIAYTPSASRPTIAGALDNATRAPRDKDLTLPAPTSSNAAGEVEGLLQAPEDAAAKQKPRN